MARIWFLKPTGQQHLLFMRNDVALLKPMLPLDNNDYLKYNISED